MHRWQRQMPKGMFLKSEGSASNLSDPAGCYTLARYCTERGLSYGETGTPISLETFNLYSQWFRENLVPVVDDLMVTRIGRGAEVFELGLSDGTSVRAQKVVIATGLDHMAHTAAVLRNLPSELLSHSADHHDLKCFKAKDVTVIGGGQSALEIAALLAEEGASVRVVVRQPSLVWNPVPKAGYRSLYRRLRYPRSGLGEGLRMWFYCNGPMLFRRLPQRIRFKRAYSELGPAGAWWLKGRVLGCIPVLVHHSVSRAEARGDRAQLTVVESCGRKTDVVTDHVISATGYRFDLQRLPFLDDRLKSELRTINRQPILSCSFESSVRGLYFTGLASASSLGPAMRFLEGTGYTARSVSRDIARGLLGHDARLALDLAGTESYHRAARSNE
jgi:glycine/D-amino acid oxidase-like deaminating enzyme